MGVGLRGLLSICIFEKIFWAFPESEPYSHSLPGEREFGCRIPDDCIDSKRYLLFVTRAFLKELIEFLQSIQGLSSIEVEQQHSQRLKSVYEYRGDSSNWARS